jgi:cell wall-associated NlpC family hydrolase
MWMLSHLLTPCVKTSVRAELIYVELSGMGNFRNSIFSLLLVLAPILYTSCKSKKILTDASKSRSLTSGSLTERYASLLNVKEKELDNQKLYRFIDSWIGVPHRSGGMDKKGVDCSAFTTILEKEIYDRSVPRTAKSMAEAVKRKYEDDLKEGDLVFFDFQGLKFSHVGVYLRNNKFVHASTSKGVIISDLKDPWYYKYFSRAGSIKD